MTDKKFSDFPKATAIPLDTYVGLHSGVDTQFPFLVNSTINLTASGSINLSNPLTKDYFFAFTGGGGSLTLPPMNASNCNLGLGDFLVFRNEGSFDYALKNNGGTTLFTINASGSLFLFLTANATANGTWDLIPVGNLGWQNAANVLISGGTIDGTIIGATTPAAATFTNLICNNLAGGVTSTVSAASTTTLTVNSNSNQILTGTTTQIYKLADATTLPLGALLFFYNNSTGLLTVHDNGSNFVLSLHEGGRAIVMCSDNSTSNGGWQYSFQMPENAEYGTLGLTIDGGLVATLGITNTSFNSGVIGGITPEAITGTIITATTNLVGNNIIQGVTSTSASGGTVNLTSTSTGAQILTGSASENYVLPDATTLTVGQIFEFNNNSAFGNLVVKDHSATTLATAASGTWVRFILLSNGSAAGTWDYYWLMPSNANYGTTGMIITGTLSASSGMDSTVIGANTPENGSFLSLTGDDLTYDRQLQYSGTDSGSGGVNTNQVVYASNANTANEIPIVNNFTMPGSQPVVGVALAHHNAATFGGYMTRGLVQIDLGSNPSVPSSVYVQTDGTIKPAATAQYAGVALENTSGTTYAVYFDPQNSIACAQRNQNLGDLTNPSLALTNLGLRNQHTSSSTSYSPATATDAFTFTTLTASTAITATFTASNLTSGDFGVLTQANTGQITAVAGTGISSIVVYPSGAVRTAGQGAQMTWLYDGATTIYLSGALTT